MLHGHWKSLVVAAVLVAACNGAAPVAAVADTPFVVTEIRRFDQPWAMTFMPDGRLLVTEKPGRLWLFDPVADSVTPVDGVPAVVYGGQGGLGDVALHPDFSRNGWVYLSFAEAGPEPDAGAAVLRAVLTVGERGAVLANPEVIWRQVPKVRTRGHYGHRILFDQDGYLWISSGERQAATPAQDLQSNLGKIVRLRDDGTVPDNNPFVGRADALPEIWSLGHRNPLGIAFDAQGQLWNVEMGPRGGDELNRVVAGANYGFPEVSEGDQYSGKSIPRHATRPEFVPPVISWTPVISPSSLIFYSGTEFAGWQGNALISGLAGVLVRVETDGRTAREAERFQMGARIRSVSQGPDGALWLLEDAGDRSRLLRVSARP